MSDKYEPMRFNPGDKITFIDNDALIEDVDGNPIAVGANGITTLTADETGQFIGWDITNETSPTRGTKND